MTPARAASASSLLAALIDGPRQLLRPVHHGRLAVHLADARGVVRCCVITRDAVRLPHAVVVPSLPREASPVSVGDGTLGWDGFTVSVARWWRPARPTLPRLRSRVDERAAARFAARWRDDLGRGDGLTPEADDAVCGALVALRAARHPVGAEVAAAVSAAPLEARTTAPSAGLLRLAAAGLCVEPLARHLAALTPTPTGLLADPRTRTEVAAIGHRSGAALLRGVHDVLPAGAAAVRR